MDETVQELKLMVPTFVGHVAPATDFADPHVPVLVREAEGLRIVLGTHDCDDMEKPDIQIERRPGGWAIFLHPLGGGDPSGYIYFLDDGRSFLVPEKGGVTDVIEMVDSLDDVPEVDWPCVTVVIKEQKKCTRCGQTSEYSGDWYDDLCPNCADGTDGEWGCRFCNRHGSFQEMGGTGAMNPNCCGWPCEHFR